MPRYSTSHECHRTPETVIQDVTYVLNAPLSLGTKFAVVNNSLRVWTEFSGKYEGCPRWTKLALLRRTVATKEGIKKRFQGLVHEHAVPNRIVAGMLFEQKAPTAESVRAVFEQFVHAVVVTKEEDNLLSVMFRQTMPPEFSDPNSTKYHEPFLRYERCEIEVINTRDNWWLALPEILRDEI
jgi:hypothetical protein